MAALSACTTAPAPFDPLPLGRSVIAPTGFVQFCQRRPDQCGVAEPAKPKVADRAELPTLLLPCEAGEVARRESGVTEGACLAPAPGLIAADAPTAELFIQPPPPADAWPQPRLTLLDYHPTATISRPDLAVDLSPWKALETGSSVDGQTPPTAYTVVSRDAVGARLRFSPALQAEIARVDVAINQAITPATDLQAFGVDNYWTLPLTDGPKAEGNCKHYALEKRRQLVADGVPADALSLAIVTTPSNEVHAVLLISTDQGDLVLDNLTDAIRPWRQTDYRWMVRQTPAAPLHWVEVG